MCGGNVRIRRQRKPQTLYCRLFERRCVSDVDAFQCTSSLVPHRRIQVGNDALLIGFVDASSSSPLSPPSSACVSVALIHRRPSSWSVRRPASRRRPRPRPLPASAARPDGRWRSRAVVSRSELWTRRPTVDWAITGRSQRAWLHWSNGQQNSPADCKAPRLRFRRHATQS